MTLEGKIQQHIIMLRIPQKDIEIALDVVSKDELVEILNRISLSPESNKLNSAMMLRQRIRNIRIEQKTANYNRQLQSQSETNSILSADELSIVDMTIRYIEDEYALHNDDELRLRDYRYLRNAYPASISRIDSMIARQLPELRIELTHVGAD